MFDKTTLAVTDRPDWHLVLYNPRPRSGTEERIARLNMVTATWHPATVRGSVMADP